MKSNGNFNVVIMEVGYIKSACFVPPIVVRFLRFNKKPPDLDKIDMHDYDFVLNT